MKWLDWKGVLELLFSDYSTNVKFVLFIFVKSGYQQNELAKATGVYNEIYRIYFGSMVTQCYFNCGN